MAGRSVASKVPTGRRRPPGGESARTYSEAVKNITVSVDDDTYRRARMKAAEQDTSVSALVVKRFLVELASTESQTNQLKREAKALRTRITTFSAANRLSRDDPHAR